MHFSIPDTQEFSGDGSTYTGYNVHINGVFHCTVRFRQLHNLHEQLRRQSTGRRLPSFPPKKLLPLTPFQLEERRIQLERYLQLVGQDSTLANSDLVNAFLLSAQQETSLEKCQEIALDIYLMNGKRISLTVLSTERSDEVLSKACQEIGLPREYVSYFSLYFIKKEDDGDITILRKLQDFESPYISHKSFPESTRIVIRKSYWDSAYDCELIVNRVALNLLYIQAVGDVERCWVMCGQGTREQLAGLQARGSKKEYLELARTLKQYGCMQFRPCVSDYPQSGSVVGVCIGPRDLVMRMGMHPLSEATFKVTRMRCWRITTIHNNEESSSTSSNGSGCGQLELSFEYLMAKDSLQWITITSEQAVLMSGCLQSMVDELLMKKTGGKRRQACDKSRKGSWSYIKRDGSSQLIGNMSPSPSTDGLVNNNGNSKTRKDPFSMNRIHEKISTSVLFRTGRDSVENEAFEGIGDEDL